MELLELSSGQFLYVDRSTGEIGSEAPFYIVYLDEERKRRWGYYCSNCEGLNTAMDTMGRIACNICPNRRMPTEWDAAHE